MTGILLNIFTHVNLFNPYETYLVDMSLLPFILTLQRDKEIK